MSKFATFAVAGGSGRVGKAVVAGLVAAGAARVVVLSRSADIKVDGAITKAVDYTSAESVQVALDGIEVVISTLGGPALANQTVLVQAAKSASVQLFVPSKFGIAPASQFAPGTPFHAKRVFRATLAELGLPFLGVANGVFPELVFTSTELGLGYATGKAHVVGSADIPISFTTVKDVGSFLGTLLTSLPSSHLVTLGDVRGQGSRATLAQSLAAYEASHSGLQIELTSTPLDQAEAELKDKIGMQFAIGWLLLAWAKGEADLTWGREVGVDNGLVEGWAPMTIEEFLAGL